MTARVPIDVRRTDVRLRPDPSRVVAKLFVPGQEGNIEGESRAGSVVDRVLGLSDDEAAATLAGVVAGFHDRHPDLHLLLEEHFELVSHRIDQPSDLSDVRRQLVGAYFTQEYAVESAAVCNPSMVAHPDQGGLVDGAVRFVMSVRAVGEGHVSSIEFRTGVIDADGRDRPRSRPAVTCTAIDPAGRATSEPCSTARCARWTTTARARRSSWTCCPTRSQATSSRAH